MLSGPTLALASLTIAHRPLSMPVSNTFLFLLKAVE